MTRNAGPGFIFVTLVLDIIGIGIMVPVLPSLVGSLLGTTDEMQIASYYGPLAALYAVMQVLFAPLLGALSDRFGRRPVILVAMAGMGVSYLILALAPSLFWLYVGRALAGVTGATITAANAYMADISTPETRSRNFGLVGAAFGVGFVLGPALGGILGEYGDRVPFFAAAGVVFINAIWGTFVLPESLPLDQRRQIRVVELTPLGGLRSLFVHPLVTGLAGVAFLQSLAQRALESIWVIHGTHRYGWGPQDNGLTLAFVGISSAIVMGGLARRVIPAVGEPRALLGGLGIMAVAFASYAFAGEAWMVFAIVPFGAFASLAGPAYQGMVTGVVPADRQGAVQGAIASLQSLTSIGAPLASAALFVAGTDGSLGVDLPGLPFLAGSGLIVLAAIVGAITLVRHPPSGSKASGDSASTTARASA